MDLEAYINLENEKFKNIAKNNGIEVPRLRGYRLMKDEDPVSKEELNKLVKDAELETAKKLCEAIPFWSSKPEWYELSSYTDYLKDFFLNKNDDGDYVSIRWDRIHGWKRKVLKREIKKQKKLILKQYETWNKYAGKDNVLYIHSRIGGNNWIGYKEKIKLVQAPWFLDRVDDYYDSTYCDFYAKIK